MEAPEADTTAPAARPPGSRPAAVHPEPSPAGPSHQLAVPVLPVMLAVIAVWGSAFTGIKLLLRDLSPGALTLGRLLVAGVTYLVLHFATRGRRERVTRRRGDTARLLFVGFTGSAGYHLALNWGEQRVSAGVAALVVASMPALVAVAARVVLGEHLTVLRVAGVATAFAGITVLVLASGERLEAHSAAGILVVFLAPVAWAAVTIASKPLSARYDGITINLAGAWLGVLATLPLAAPSLDGFGRLDAGGWAWLLWLGAVSTALAYVAYAFALRAWSATAVASFVSLVPAAGLLWAWALLDEVPTVGSLAGGALVLGGVALVQTRRRSP